MGGIAGYNAGTVEGCFFYGYFSTPPAGNFNGSIVGFNESGAVSSSYYLVGSSRRNLAIGANSTGGSVAATVVAADGTIEGTTDNIADLFPSFAAVSTNTISISTAITGGTLTPSETSARPGAEITLTPVSGMGNEVSEVSITDALGNKTVIANSGGYKFTMPNSAVTASASFGVDSSPTVVTIKSVDGVFADVALK